MKDMYKKGESNIAWFKLAQMVSKGEKEKALSLFKLLSYSFDDTAYILQVEGDLLWAFEDKDAFAKYQQAAFLYKKEGKLLAAVAVYEHMLALEPTNHLFLSMLLELYAMLNLPEKYLEIIERVARAYNGKKLKKDQVELMLKNSFDVMVAEHSLESVRYLKDRVVMTQGLGELSKLIKAFC